MSRIFILICLSGCLAGCATQEPAPPHDVIAIPNEPVPDRELTPEKIAMLESRLARLRVGMNVNQVLDILNLSSLHVYSFAYANETGTTYHFQPNHTLILATTPADYDAVFRWAKFDNKIWPKPHEPREEPAQSPVPVAP